MPEQQEEELAHERLHQVEACLDNEDAVALADLVNAFHPAEIAHILESLPREERIRVWEQVDPRHDGDVLLHVNEDLRADFIRDMDAGEIVAASENLDTDDLADFIQDLPRDVVPQILAAMDQQDRRRLESVLSFDEDSAGGLMNPEMITVRADVTLDVVLRYLRLRGEIPEMTDSLLVVDRENRYVGLLLLTDLLLRSPEVTVESVMVNPSEPIQADTTARDVANIFEHRDLISAPVIDKDGKLIGRITIDDVVDVIRDEADHSFLGQAGLSEEDDMFAPVGITARRRGIWLGFNLLTVLVASWVIGLFEAAIHEVVALAVLMPIVASMGGIAGSQTLTIVIRGLALGQVGASNAASLLRKEVAVGTLNGVLWSIVIGMIAVLWFDDFRLGAVIASAIVVNLIVGAFAGAIIPLVMNRLGSDPALGGSVVLTAVTDAVGFFAFLGLASLVYLG